MKRSIVLLVAALFAVTAVAAQESPAPPQKRTPEERAKHQTERMTKELALSAEQQAKLRSLLLEREKNREAKMADRKAEMEKMDKEMKLLLSPEQYAKFAQKREEMKQKNKERRMAHKSMQGPPPPPADK